jgi:hypothetical protein
VLILTSSGSLTVTDLHDFNGLTQTTNLGVRSSNLFGRATIHLNSLKFFSLFARLLPPCFSAEAMWKQRAQDCEADELVLELVYPR